LAWPSVHFAPLRVRFGLIATELMRRGKACPQSAPRKISV
jgi:hypothetical protein